VLRTQLELLLPETEVLLALSGMLWGPRAATTASLTSGTRRP
jgi:hypothetical protein